MADITRSGQVAGDPTQAAQDGLFSQHCRDLCGSIYAILERYNASSLSHKKSHCQRGFWNLPGFDPNQNCVHHSHPRRIIRGLDWIDDKIPCQALHA
jgi:hypothetical protein